MPSSFGLWFGAYAESLVDDLQLMQAAYRICNRNPLGSAAGYGSSFPLNRQMTTDLLGFDSLDYNIMPHKKNPDVFELTRAKCNKLQGLPQQIILISNNLPSGYFRDLQIIKEVFLPAFDELKDCLRMVTHMMREVKVNEHILDDDKYSLLFSVEEVNRRVLAGMPFRDAYKQVGLDIEAGKFIPSKSVNHTHEGSIGNLCNESITAMMRSVIGSFSFERMNEAEKKLIHG